MGSGPPSARSSTGGASVSRLLMLPVHLERGFLTHATPGGPFKGSAEECCSKVKTRCLDLADRSEWRFLRFVSCSCVIYRIEFILRPAQRSGSPQIGKALAFLASPPPRPPLPLDCALRAYRICKRPVDAVETAGPYRVFETEKKAVTFSSKHVSCKISYVGVRRASFLNSRCSTFSLGQITSSKASYCSS